MSAIESQESNITETDSGSADSDNTKYVPVSESIRYRKRAQSAENKVEALSRELSQAKAEASKMVEKLSRLQVEQELMRKLAAAGVVDLESAVLIAKARLEAEEGAETESVIEQLKKEKQYLFGGQQNTVGRVKKTAAVKDKMTNKQAVLERAAKMAAKSGKRTDLQEYLKMRRNLV